MSNTADSQTALSRRTWISLVAVELVLFALANLTAKNSSHPGTLSLDPPNSCVSSVGCP